MADCFPAALIAAYVLRLSIPDAAPMMCFPGSADAIILNAAGTKL